MREAGWERRKFGEPTNRNEIDNWFVSGFQWCVGVCGVLGCALTLTCICVCVHTHVCVLVELGELGIDISESIMRSFQIILCYFQAQFSRN